MFPRLLLGLAALVSSATALSENSVVLGHGVSNSHVGGCVDDLGMNCWYLWTLEARKTIVGPPVKGLLKALSLQHTDASQTFVDSVELFILAPLPKPDVTGAKYSILALSPKKSGGNYCVSINPKEFNLPIDETQITYDATAHAYCFGLSLFVRGANNRWRGP